MNKISKFFIILFLTLFIGSYFSINFVQAQNNKLILEATKECDIQYSGDSCVAELKLTNNTNEILDGEALLHIEYQGVCSNNELRNFDGKGIQASFSPNGENQLNFSGWEEGITTVSGFKIAKGKTQSELEIETAPNLCSGKYAFTLTLKGTTKEEEEIVASSPVVIGGSGAYIPPVPDAILEINIILPVNLTKNSATIKLNTGTTDSFCRIIYDIYSHPVLSGTSPHYGYQWTSAATFTKKPAREITLKNLEAGKTYHYRVVCRGSSNKVTSEYVFTTMAENDINSKDEEIPGNSDGGPDQGGIIREERGSDNWDGSEQKKVGRVLGEETEKKDEPLDEPLTEGGIGGTEEEGVAEEERKEKGKKGFFDNFLGMAGIVSFLGSFNIKIILFLFLCSLILFVIIKKKKKKQEEQKRMY